MKIKLSVIKDNDHVYFTLDMVIIFYDFSESLFFYNHYILNKNNLFCFR